MVLTKEQRRSLYRVWKRPIYDQPNPLTYRQFRRTVKQGWDCIMVEWAGMWLGIEPDGYTHS